MPVRLKGLAVNSALVIGSICLAILLAELYLRITNYDINPAREFTYHPDLGWVHDPAWMAREDPADPRIVNLGLNEERKSKVVLVVGDSFTAASGILYRDTYMGVLQDLLGAEWSVFSLAAGGWGTGQELIALRDFGLALEPSVVVLQVFPLNDVCNNTFELRGVCAYQDRYRPYFRVNESGARPTRRADLMGWLRKTSALAGLIDTVFDPGVLRLQRDLPLEEFKREATAYRNGNAKRIGLKWPSDVYIGQTEEHQLGVLKKGWLITESLFREIGLLLKAGDIPWISLVVPYRHTLTDERWGKLKRALPAHSTPDYGDRHAEQILAKISNQTISMRDFFERHPQFVETAFVPDSHFNKVGHCLAAVLLYKAMAREGLVDSRAADQEIAAERYCAAGKTDPKS